MKGEPTLQYPICAGIGGWVGEINRFLVIWKISCPVAARMYKIIPGRRIFPKELCAFLVSWEISLEFKCTYLAERNGFLLPRTCEKRGPTAVWEQKGFLDGLACNIKGQLCRALREMRGRVTVIGATAGSLYRSKPKNQFGRKVKYLRTRTRKTPPGPMRARGGGGG